MNNFSKTTAKGFFMGLIMAGLLSLGTQAQVKIGANPTTIAATSNLEVEATNGKKTIVDKATGQLTIQDGTEGAGKMLTADATGNATWQNRAKMPRTIIAGTGGSLPNAGCANVPVSGTSLTLPNWLLYRSGRRTIKFPWRFGV